MKTSYIFFLLFFCLLNLTGFYSFSQVGFNEVPPPGGSWGGGHIFGTQDPKGYMWFAAVGLHRYDGYTYKSYFNNPLDSNSLAFNRIQAVMAARDGIIWVGTNGGGLDRLDPETGIFTHFRHDSSDPTSISNNLISIILEDKNGKIWVGTEGGGLNCLDPKTGMIIRFKHDPNDLNSLSNDEVRALYEDSQGTLWVGTGFPYTGDPKWKKGGLNRYDRTTHKFTRFVHDPNDPFSLIDNRIWTIYEDSKGNFLIGTAGDGLHIMDREKGKFERHQYQKSDPNKLSRPPVRNTLAWLDDLITFIQEDAEGNIWIGTNQGGLNRYAPESRKMDHYLSLLTNPKDKNHISGLTWGFTSKDGVLWLAGGDGVFRIDPMLKQIPHYDIGSPVRSMLQDSTGKLWIGTNEGLLVYDSTRINKKKYVHDLSDSASLSNNNVLSILEDKKGIIWIGTFIGLNRFNRQLEKFTRYFPNTNSDIEVFTSLNAIHSIYEDSEEFFWLGTSSVLSLMDRQSGKLRYFGDDPIDLERKLTLYDNLVFQNSEGYLWIGTRTGLSRYDKHVNAFKQFLPGILIKSIFEDEAFRLWIGTNRGLYFFDSAKNEFVNFINLAEGLTQNITVFHILEAYGHNLWINTSIGLFKLGPDRQEINSFGKSHGMIPSVDGNQKNCFKGIGGELFFGEFPGNGYYAFFPEKLVGNTIAPIVNITGFRLGDQLIVPGESKFLSEPISQTQEIHLPHNKNTFSFVFAGIHFANPEENKHLFMLENLDHDWRKAGDEKTADYYNVPPGKYVFRVKAANNDGVWAEKSIQVAVSPPWWSTWWAYILYGFVFVAGAVTLYRIQKKRVVAIEREKTRTRELALAKEIEKAYTELKTTQAQLIQSEKMASLGDLTAGIAHEIQNPLNFVNNFSDLNKEMLEEMKEALAISNKQLATGNDEAHQLVTINMQTAIAIANDVIDNEEKINLHGKRAESIVKSMLQHSRKSSGVTELTDINALADEYMRLAYYGLRAKDKAFNAEYKMDLDQTLPLIKIIPQDIGRALLNLFNNAFWTVNERKKGEMENGKRRTEGADSLSGLTFSPTVTLTTKSLQSKIEIRIHDNGTGIPHNIINKIFQPFFTTKPPGQGTGLGLSLAYDIIKAHHGEIKVKSLSAEQTGLEGESLPAGMPGTEFVISLPI